MPDNEQENGTEGSSDFEAELRELDEKIGDDEPDPEPKQKKAPVLDVHASEDGEDEDSEADSDEEEESEDDSEDGEEEKSKPEAAETGDIPSDEDAQKEAFKPFIDDGRRIVADAKQKEADFKTAQENLTKIVNELKRREEEDGISTLSFTEQLAYDAAKEAARDAAKAAKDAKDFEASYWAFVNPKLETAKIDAALRRHEAKTPQLKGYLPEMRELSSKGLLVNDADMVAAMCKALREKATGTRAKAKVASYPAPDLEKVEREVAAQRLETRNKARLNVGRLNGSGGKSAAASRDSSVPRELQADLAKLDRLIGNG